MAQKWIVNLVYSGSEEFRLDHSTSFENDQPTDRLLFTRLKALFVRLMSGPLMFPLVALQFALIAVVVERYSFESEMFRTVLWCSLAGFVIHHVLPSRFKAGFFLALSLGCLVLVLGHQPDGLDLIDGIGPAAALMTMGMGLVGICHLRVSFRWLVTLLIGVAALFASLRVDQWISLGNYSIVLSVLGSMFMFRVMVYIYDLENMKERPTLVQTLSYLFLLPNVCFAAHGSDSSHGLSSRDLRGFAVGSASSGCVHRASQESRLFRCRPW